MEHKWRVTNEAGESIVIITTSISNLPESFSLTEGKEMTETVKIERIVEIDFGEEILARIKEQEGETIECKMCGHRLHKDWVWCPWCRWEIARQEGRCYGDE